MIILAIAFLACLAVFLEMAGRAPLEVELVVDEQPAEPSLAVDANG